MSEEVQTPETPETPPQPVSVIDDEGRLTEAYREQLGELADHSVFKKYDYKLEDIFKGSINAAELVGKRASDFWASEDPEDVAARNKIMGVPEGDAEYSFTVPELPEGMNKEQFEAGAKDFAAFAKENGWPEKFVQQALEYDARRGSQIAEQQYEQYQLSLNEAEAELRKEWKGDKYQYNIDKAKEALDFLDLGDLKDDPAYGNNPKFIKAIFDKVVPIISDDDLIQARQSQSYATVKDQLDELDAKMYAFEGPTQDPRYMNMIKQREELLRKIT